jgi:hypothetical protein
MMSYSFPFFHLFLVSAAAASTSRSPTTVTVTAGPADGHVTEPQPSSDTSHRAVPLWRAGPGSGGPPVAGLSHDS